MEQSEHDGARTVKMLIAQCRVVGKDVSLLPNAQLVGAEGERLLGRELLQDSPSALLQKLESAAEPTSEDSSSTTKSPVSTEWISGDAVGA
eukprot:scaffold1044_cov120-Isochrysis_galbana.AAC.14